MSDPKRKRIEICTVPEGEAIFIWPALMSPQSAQDVVEWLTFVLDKYKAVAHSEDAR